VTRMRTEPSASLLLGGALEVVQPGAQGSVEGLLQGRGLGTHGLAVPCSWVRTTTPWSVGVSSHTWIAVMRLRHLARPGAVIHQIFRRSA